MSRKCFATRAISSEISPEAITIIHSEADKCPMDNATATGEIKCTPTSINILKANAYHTWRFRTTSDFNKLVRPELILNTCNNWQEIREKNRTLLYISLPAVPVYNMPAIQTAAILTAEMITEYPKIAFQRLRS